EASIPWCNRRRYFQELKFHWVQHRPLVRANVAGVSFAGRTLVGKQCDRERTYMSPSQNTSSSVLPSGGGRPLLNPSDTVILLLDHQTGLFQTVKDIPVADLRRNTTVLAKLGTLLKIPIIMTASEPNGPNGPLMPEIKEAAPQAVFVPRKGEVNAW